MKAKHKTIKSKSEEEELAVQLTITSTKSEKFIDELEKLCKKFSVDKDYFFKFN